MAWLYLSLAIGSEIVGTLGLRAIAHRPNVWAVVLVAVAYLVSFTALAYALRSLNVGVVYAIWSAVGTAAVAILGAVLFADRLNLTAVLGLGLVILGVVVLVASGSTHQA